VRRLFGNFAVKLANLWKFETGETVNHWITRPEEWGIIQGAQKRGQGLLFVTLHLGDWEHGGLLLAQRGIKLMVLTLPEPGTKLTEVRSASRARWGIETLVIGEDSFAFVEVIRRLQDGGAVALSIDRPPARGGVPVEFFGRPFQASNAAAELARASGCAVMGVVVMRRPEGIRVCVLPEFTYDRQKLGDREARRQMTQQILRAFEPQIREHLDQWYQFVPIWAKPDAT
jgi:KDO2-lipid IV(A) lauroyltransferase